MTTKRTLEANRVSARKLNSDTVRYRVGSDANKQFAIGILKVAIAKYEAMGNDYDIIISASVVPRDGKRPGKTQYEDMLNNAIESTGTSTWYNGKNKYLFNFIEHKYMWGNRNLYLTAAEQYALYRYLVLNEGAQWKHIAKLRTKFGEDFLIDIEA